MTPIEWLEAEADARDKESDWTISPVLACNNGALAMLKSDHRPKCLCQTPFVQWSGGVDTYRTARTAAWFVDLAIEPPPGRCPA